MWHGNQGGRDKFFVITVDITDKHPWEVQNTIMSHCSHSVWCENDGKAQSALPLHQAAHEDGINKFAIFCAVNTEMLYLYKRMVLDVAAVSSLLYSSE